MLIKNYDQLPKLIQESHKVLDVGGWHSPLNRANAVIDIMPYETRQQKNAVLTEVWPEERFTKETFHQQDICTTPWPFKDKEFDFSICGHTLEDLRDPLQVCKELIRVSKAGYIEVPSRFAESTRGVERPFYCGYYHHRWLCELEGQKLVFMFKPAMLHAYRQFHFRKPWNKRVNPEVGTLGFFWRDAFPYEERILIERDDVQNNLREFKNSYRDRSDLFVPKYTWWGKRI